MTAKTELKEAEPAEDHRPKDFWAIVAVDSNLDQVLVLQRSSDCDEVELFSNGLDFTDNGGETDWLKKGMQGGIYRLQLAPGSSQGYEGDWDYWLGVAEVTPLTLLPELGEDGRPK